MSKRIGRSHIKQSCEPRTVGRPVSLDPALGRVMERHQEEWYAIHAGVPGAEVNRDADITWMIQNGMVWSNGGTSLRFTPDTVESRLDEILASFAKRSRGVGFWVDVEATPENLEQHLKHRRFRCRKYFPGMWCDLNALPDVPLPDGIVINEMQDHSIFHQAPHPYFGRISTPISRYELGRQIHLSTLRPQRVFDFVAWTGERPVGACTMFLSKAAAGFHDVGVLESERGRGIGSALMAYALRFARDRDKKQAVLLASGMGFSMYQRVGFREVCRMGYWYRA